MYDELWMKMYFITGIKDKRTVYNVFLFNFIPLKTARNQLKFYIKLTRKIIVK